MQNTIWVVALIEGLLLLIYCTYLAYNYAAKGRTPLCVYLVTVLCWFLGLMVIYLLPLDIYTVSTAHHLQT